MYIQLPKDLQNQRIPNKLFNKKDHTILQGTVTKFDEEIPDFDVLSENMEQCKNVKSVKSFQPKGIQSSNDYSTSI